MYDHCSHLHIETNMSIRRHANLQRFPAHSVALRRKAFPVQCGCLFCKQDLELVQQTRCLANLVPHNAA
jgi:hypothetical protein